MFEGRVFVAAFVRLRKRAVQTFSRLRESIQSGLFKGTLQWMLMLPGEVHHLLDLGSGNLVGEDAANAHTLLMNVHHNLGGFFATF